VPRVDTAFKSLRDRRRAETTAALIALFGEMKDDVLARWSAGAKRLIAARWDKVLAGVILGEHMLTASEVAERVAAALGSEFDPVVMTGWLAANADVAAGNINAHTADDIGAVDPDTSDDPVGHVFGILATSGAAGLAVQMVTTSAGFAAHDVARAAGASSKVWRVNSTNPRAAHSRMNGQAAALGELFSNGMNWPGDPAGGADNNAGCKCSLTILKS
jgi:hypothetical protein